MCFFFQSLDGDVKSEVQLDPKIALFESPATILASGLMTDPAVALRNAVKVINLEYTLPQIWE